MPPILTSSATITCAHGGRVSLAPRQTSVMIKGSPLLCEPDLVGAPIVGCPQPTTTSSKPCTVVVSTVPGSTSPKVIVAGRPAYVATLGGITDGIPPASLVVVDPGQAAVIS
jgi:hypothetical protein